MALLTQFPSSSILCQQLWRNGIQQYFIYVAQTPNTASLNLSYIHAGFQASHIDQLETINSDPQQKQYLWFVLANYVTMHIRIS